MTKTITADPKRWYCLRTATRREKDAAEKLVEHFTTALIEGGSSCEAEVYLPLEKRRSKLRRVPEGTAEEDAYETVERPLIQGYVFVKVASVDAVKACVRDVEAEIDGVEFIHAALEFRRNNGRMEPFPIANSIIEGLMKEEAAGEFDYTPKSKRFRPGKNERVLIAKGQFQGYIAEVIEMTPDERYARIQMKLGRMDVPVGHLVPIEPGVAA